MDRRSIPREHFQRMAAASAERRRANSVPIIRQRRDRVVLAEILNVRLAELDEALREMARRTGRAA